MVQESVEDSGGEDVVAEDAAHSVKDLLLEDHVGFGSVQVPPLRTRHHAGGFGRAESGGLGRRGW